MAGDAKPFLEMFLDYYNHVMIDLRDPRYMSINDQIQCSQFSSHCTTMIDPIACYVVRFEVKLKVFMRYFLCDSLLPSAL